MTRNRVVPLAAMAGILLLTYGLDKISAIVKDSIRATFRVYQGYAWLTLLEFLFAGMVILLIWVVLAWSKRSNLVGTIFVVIGLMFLLFSTFFRFTLSSIPLPYASLYRYQLQDLPFFQRVFATLFWNMAHGHSILGLFLVPPTSFQFFTKASVLIALLGVVKFFQKPPRAQLTTDHYSQ